jgi:hypothetical protein
MGPTKADGGKLRSKCDARESTWMRVYVKTGFKVRKTTESNWRNPYNHGDLTMIAHDLRINSQDIAGSRPNPACNLPLKTP